MAEPKENKENSIPSNQIRGENFAWQEIFQREGEKGRDAFPDIQENLPEIVETFKKAGVKNVLDLGCGQGRHSLYLAENGMNVSGIDFSNAGVEQTQKKLAVKGLNGYFRQGDIYDRLPYPDSSLDAIVSTQTIDHNYIEKIRELIREMERVLTPNGMIFITVAKREKPGKGKEDFEEIAPLTVIPREGTEKGLIHYCFNMERLENEFKNNFEIKTWEQSNGIHLCLLGKRKEIK